VAAVIKVFSECLIIGTVRVVGIDWVAEMMSKSIDAAKLVFEAVLLPPSIRSDITLIIRKTLCGESLADCSGWL
jgi:hypothetical protein